MQIQPSEKPQTFQQRLLAHELTRHKQRLAEIKKSEAKLKLFEPVAAELAARGYDLALDWCLRIDDSLRITMGSTTAYDYQLYTTLLDMGFVEQRRVGAYYVTVHLEKGPLALAVTVDGVAFKCADVCTHGAQEVAQEVAHVH
ncbi:MAG: hypothetical protein P4L87_01790 [Formivibrio sp.]|nr:hypothetical protein [Formivibrio sp.]